MALSTMEVLLPLAYKFSIPPSAIKIMHRSKKSRKKKRQDIFNWFPHIKDDQFEKTSKSTSKMISLR